MSDLATEHVIKIILLIGMLTMFYLVSAILEGVRQVVKRTAMMQTTLASTQLAIERLAKKLEPEILDD
jgi:ABC-type polysaccharide/polyol phosphate export permease